MKHARKLLSGHQNLILGSVMAMALGLTAFPGAAGRSCASCQGPQPTLPGESVTLLSDGTYLLLGGQSEKGPVASAAILNAGKNTTTSLSTALEIARARHTATVLPDGTVLVLGGVGADGTLVATAEKFDPATGHFSEFSLSGFAPRYGHTATLLSDGTVLVAGGTTADGLPTRDSELIDPKTNIATSASRLVDARTGHSATLLPSGQVLIHGGSDADGNPVSRDEIYDPKTRSFTITPSSSASARKPEPSASPTPVGPEVSGWFPHTGDTAVPTNTNISVLFSAPVSNDSVSDRTVILSDSNGVVSATTVVAEGGRLVFVNPASPLQTNTKYTITVSGVTGPDDRNVAQANSYFETVNASSVSVGGSSESTGSSNGSQDTVWVPTSDWRTDLPPSPWQSLPPYQAPPGVTALSGQALTLTGAPLAGVTMQVGKHWVKTDASGRFLLRGLTPGAGVLLINGTTANNNGSTYGIFQVLENLASGRTTVLPFTIWMPMLDMAHAVTLSSPTTEATVITNPLMPGLQLHIPAGTIIRDINGNVVQSVSITPVPLDRPPFPLPAGVQVPIYFTIQPGGAQLWTTSGKWAWAQLYYPNPSNFSAGTRFDFWNYDPTKSGWYVYGRGSVSRDGSEVIPDPGVGIWTFSGAMVGSPAEPPTTGSPQCDSGCDPIDASTGLLRHSQTDLRLSDIIPIRLTRTYLSQDSTSRAFGVGFTDNYEIYITNNGAPNYTAVDIVLPDGQKVHYVNTLGSSFPPNYVATLTSVPSFYGSVITWNGGWSLRLRNGTTLQFPAEGATPASAALRSITDRYGNKQTIARDMYGNVTQVTSPSGRWIQFQHDSNNRITQATDNLGRTVNYTYDSCASGYLCSVVDANGATTTYSYYTSSNPPPSGFGGLGNMFRVANPRGNTEMTVLYDANGRVAKQTLGDGTSSFQFGYAVSGSAVTQTSITDPNGNLEQKSFDSNGFVTADAYAVGQSYQQIFNYTRDPNTELITAVTDPLNREACYAYDANGNLTSVTRLCATQQAVTTSLTYDSTFSQLTSATDPLGHLWTLSRDSIGNLTAITDPNNNAVGLTYNVFGQPLSVTDAAGDTAKFNYSFGDLSSITDPLGNTAALSTDEAGRIVGITDPLNSLTQLAYDNLDHLTQITDANSGNTSLTYDPDGDLVAVSDASGNKTSYAYDNRDRRITRTDALAKADSYTYDANSNLTSHTDRNGNVVNYTYDGLNRPTQAQYNVPGSGGGLTVQSTISYAWDAGNRVTQGVDSIAGTINRTWDNLDRLTQEQTPQGTVSYTYDNADRRATMTVSGQNQVSYTWDNANRLTGIAQGNTSVGFSYDTSNRRTQLTLPNGVTVAYSYDQDSHITGLTYSAGSTQLGNLTYGYDADGRRTALGGSLAAVMLPSNVAGGTSTAYNADNEQTAFNGTSLSYDSVGNLTADGTNTYTWDARHHLTAISGGASASFVYDAFGRRMSKAIGGVTTQFVYDRLNPVQEIQSGAPVANLLTGLRVDEYFTRTDSTGTAAFLADALGSTIGLVGSAGSIATSYTYQPFGAVTSGGAASGNVYQFTGRENDGTGLYFYRARYYSPTFQRFVSQDPLGFDGGDTNLFAYVWNSPLAWIDPSGLGGIPAPGGPPPIPLPPGKNGQPNSWVPAPPSGTGDRTENWKPQYPVPSDQGGQPRASWDSAHGHWDYDPGDGSGRQRFDPQGNPVSHYCPLPSLSLPSLPKPPPWLPLLPFLLPWPGNPLYGGL